MKYQILIVYASGKIWNRTPILNEKQFQTYAGETKDCVPTGRMLRGGDVTEYIIGDKEARDSYFRKLNR